MVEVVNATLLIVEDDLFTCKVIAEYCNQKFREVWIANSSTEAFALYEKHKPTIILSDIKLPDYSGLEFIKKIRSGDNQTMIYILSGYTTQEYLLEAVTLYLEDFIQKPISTAKLDKFIASCMSKTFSKIVLSHKENIFYCYQQKILLCEDQKIYLTYMEIMFLELLLQYKGQVVTYEIIERELYLDKEFKKNSLRTLSSRLRKKMGTCLIYSHPEIGYRFAQE